MSRAAASKISWRRSDHAAAVAVGRRRPRSVRPSGRFGETRRLARRLARGTRRLKALLERGDRRLREAHGGDERRDVLVARGDHRAGYVGAVLLEVTEQRLDQPASDALLPRRRIDAEELDPARRFVEAELAAADLAEHEADDAAVDLGDLRRVRVAADVVRDALLPDLRPIAAGDPLVDAADRFDVELGEGTDTHVGHRMLLCQADHAAAASGCSKHARQAWTIRRQISRFSARRASRPVLPSA